MCIPFYVMFLPFDLSLVRSVIHLLRIFSSPWLFHALNLIISLSFCSLSFSLSHSLSLSLSLSPYLSLSLALSLSFSLHTLPYFPAEHIRKMHKSLFFVHLLSLTRERMNRLVLIARRPCTPSNLSLIQTFIGPYSEVRFNFKPGF